MAECHPVGFQWVMEAKARGAKVIHIDPRFTRTSRGRRPARAAPGRQRHRVPRRHRQLHPQQREVLPRLRPRLHQRGHDPAARTSRTSTTSTACSPATTRRPGTYDTSSWVYEGRRSTPRPAAAGDSRGGSQGDGGGQDTRSEGEESAQERAAGHEMGGHGAAWSTPRSSGTRRCSTRAASSRCSSGTTPATRPEMVQADLRHPAGDVPRGLRGGHRQQRARPDHDAGSTRSAGRTTRSACSTSAARRSSSCCWATWAGPAAASWRCAGTPASRAPPTSRPCSTCCPATCRCPRPASTTPSTTSSTASPARPEGLLDQRPTPTRSACSRPGGATRPPRRTTSPSTTCRG